MLASLATFLWRGSKVGDYKKNRPKLVNTDAERAARLAFDKATVIPRMIVHPILYWALFAIGILLYLSLLTLAWQTPTRRIFGDAFGLFYESGQVFALTAGAVALVAYNFIWRPLAAGLGVGKDIIGYFAVTRKEDRANPEMRGLAVQKYIPETLDPNNKYRPLIRDRINGRFATVLEQLVAAEQPDEVIIISHSQGTVVAYEAIRDGVLGQCGVKNCQLITMGSPLWHVYKRYFPSRVDLLDRGISGLKSWENIYRIDDYVGTSIGDLEGDWPVNHPVAQGGHLGYWSDSEVREILSRDALSELAARDH
jgi:peptidoglycan hydrolase-like protein with peptidoglycan-binding domain